MKSRRDHARSRVVYGALAVVTIALGLASRRFGAMLPASSRLKQHPNFLTRCPIMHPLSRILMGVIAASALSGCDGANGADTPQVAAERVTAAHPHLPAAAQVAVAIIVGERPCESPVPSYPGCEADHGQVLLLAPDVEGDAGRRVEGLLFVPPGRRPALAMTLWHFDSLGVALGHGWHQVTAIAHVD